MVFNSIWLTCYSCSSLNYELCSLLSICSCLEIQSRQTIDKTSFLIMFSPDLMWRDVQYLIVYTANPHLTAGPLTRNGAGLAVSRQYGFGVMDAEAMVTRARHWINVPPQMEHHVTDISE